MVTFLFYCKSINNFMKETRAICVAFKYLLDAICSSKCQAWIILQLLAISVIYSIHFSFTS